MRFNFARYMMGICLSSLILCGVLINSVQAADLKKETIRDVSDLKDVIKNLKKALQTKNFILLKSYAPKSEPLYWAVCNSDTSDNLSFDTMNRVLIDHSKGVQIQINDKPSGGLIETKGWQGERPYFYFQFTRVDNRWVWLGVCRSQERSLDFTISEGK